MPSTISKWYLQESNRGHTDFQSDALPTELRHHHQFWILLQRYNFFSTFVNFFQKNLLNPQKSSTFASAYEQPYESIRDVAQLVAHYVRDVGVGRSSRLIPTITKSENKESGWFSTTFLFLSRIVIVFLAVIWRFKYFYDMRAKSERHRLCASHNY